MRRGMRWGPKRPTTGRAPGSPRATASRADRTSTARSRRQRSRAQPRISANDALVLAPRPPSVAVRYHRDMPRQVLVLLPDRDFDVTEVAVPWKLLVRAGHRVAFATSHGEPAA